MWRSSFLFLYPHFFVPKKSYTPWLKSCILFRRQFIRNCLQFHLNNSPFYSMNIVLEQSGYTFIDKLVFFSSKYFVLNLLFSELDQIFCFLSLNPRFQRILLFKKKFFLSFSIFFEKWNSLNIFCYKFDSILKI